MSSPDVSDFVRSWATARERAAEPQPGRAEQARSLLDLIEAQLDNQTQTSTATAALFDTTTEGNQPA